MEIATYPKSSSFSYIVSTLGDFSSRVNFLNTLIRKKKIHADLLSEKRSFNTVEKDMLTKNGAAETLKVLELIQKRLGLNITKFN